VATAAPEPWPVTLPAARAALLADPAALAAATLADAAGHAAEAVPELLRLARPLGADRAFSRPALNEAIHCLASGLEAALDASCVIEADLRGEPRREGETALLIMVRDFLGMPQ